MNIINIDICNILVLIINYEYHYVTNTLTTCLDYMEKNDIHNFY